MTDCPGANGLICIDGWLYSGMGMQIFPANKKCPTCIEAKDVDPNLTRIPEITQHTFDFNKVHHWTDLKAIMKVMDLHVGDDGSDKFKDIRRFYKDD